MDAESVSARPQWIGAYLKAPGIPAGLGGVTQLAAAVPTVEEKARDPPGEGQSADRGRCNCWRPVRCCFLLPFLGTSDLPGTVSASPAANGAPNGFAAHHPCLFIRWGILCRMSG